MRFGRICLLALCLMLAVHACAQPFQVQHTEDFNLQKFEVLPDGRVIACGCTGTPGNARGAMFLIGPDGASEEITPAADTYEGHYRDVIPLDADSMIALRSVPDAYTWRVARIDSGEITWMTGAIENVHSLDRAGDSFLMYCKPEPATMEIRCMNFEGEQLWKIRLEERIVIEGILTGEDRHIAYGYKLEEPRGDGKSQHSALLMFEFDSHGEIIWRMDGASYDNSEITHAAWAPDGSAVVIEDGGLVKYDRDRIIWRRKFEGNMAEQVMAVDGGYLVARGVSRCGEIYRIREDGALESMTMIEDVLIGDVYLFESTGGAYLLVSQHFGPVQLTKLEL